ncbi:MAG: hypothetical protein CME61_02775 [Halobacteriovoraceae bacterium]|nr:hypothetical protein [Halobacteriovoraceae bacterium]
MKPLLLISFLTLVTLTAEANHSTNTETFTYRGGDTFENVRLSDIKEVWVNQTRTIQSTCTRQEPYQVRVCRTNYGPRPSHHSGRHYSGHPNRRRRPGHRPPSSRQTCRMETRYRTVSYSCPRTETVRVRKPDMRFHADVNFDFVDHTYNSFARSNFSLTLNQKSLRVSVRDHSNGTPLLFLARSKRRVDNSRRNVYEILANYKVDVFEQQTIESPFTMPMKVKPRLKHGLLRLKVGEILSTKNLELVVEAKESQWGDKRRIVLTGNQISHRPSHRSPYISVIEIDFQRYFPNMDLYNGVEVKAELKLSSKLEVLNSGSLRTPLKSSGEGFLRY